MQRVQGNVGVTPLKCTNPKKDWWKIRWDITDIGEGVCEYMEEAFDHRPTMEEIRGVIEDWCNKKTSEAILSGYTWRGKPVWLSSENQMNFKAAYDIAVQTNGATLPVRFKLGEDGEGRPVYHDFTSIEEFTDFYTKAMEHISKSLNEGWAEKDEINKIIAEWL